jgi:hypothetical protein
MTVPANSSLAGERDNTYHVSPQSGQSLMAIWTQRVSMQCPRKLPVPTAVRLNRINLDRNVVAQRYVLSTSAEKKKETLSRQRRMSRMNVEACREQCPRTTGLGYDSTLLSSQVLSLELILLRLV